MNNPNAPREFDLKSADEILVAYTKPYDNTIDNGNLFFAATEYKDAYEKLQRERDRYRAALEFYANKENWNRFEDLGARPVPLNEFLKNEWAKIVEDSGKRARKVLNGED